MRTLPTIIKQTSGQQLEEPKIQTFEGAVRRCRLMRGAFAATIARQILPGWVHGLPGLESYQKL
jgi:hypothetical protein